MTLTEIRKKIRAYSHVGHNGYDYVPVMKLTDAECDALLRELVLKAENAALYRAAHDHDFDQVLLDANFGHSCLLDGNKL